MHMAGVLFREGPIVSNRHAAFHYNQMMDGRKHSDDEYTKESSSSTPEPKVGPQVLKPIGRSAATGHMTQLAHDFEPGEQDVVCGRGKKYVRAMFERASCRLCSRAHIYRCYSHRGNAVFRELVMVRPVLPHTQLCGSPFHICCYST